MAVKIIRQPKSVVPLHKTVIVIWTEHRPPDEMTLQDLAKEAEEGEGYCSHMETIRVEDPVSDTHWDGTEFFNDLTPIKDEVDG